MIDAAALLTIAGMLVSAGVAWGGARAGSRGVLRELRDFKKQTNESRAELRELIVSHIEEDTRENRRRNEEALRTERRLSHVEARITRQGPKR